MSPQDFVNKVLAMAREAETRFGVPAAVAVGQAVLETGYGSHVRGNNLFNIKWTGSGKHTELYVQEWIGGKPRWVRARFRAYDSWQESLEDWCRLMQAPRYDQCLAHTGDPINYIDCIWRSGYATDPRYPQKVVQIMRRHGLID
ncbi:MAG: glucosaminidase domain-containing protein [Firmicutes bacterium]|nr:glucosaminidase domain-containing protein [Bacillota bacterium]